MSWHIVLRGALEYADEGAADAALQSLRRSMPDNWIVNDGIQRKGATLAAAFDAFVGGDENVDTFLLYLQEIAATAVGGAILFDEEGMRKLRVAPKRRKRAAR